MFDGVSLELMETERMTERVGQKEEDEDRETVDRV